MNYFSRLKPILNKLSQLNVYDSLYVVRAYMQAYDNGGINKDCIPGIDHPETNSVEVWFADFIIANIFKYCDDVRCQKSLREVNTRFYICNKIEELHSEISKKQMNQDVFVWLNSYIFNQFKIISKENELRSLYRYFSLYNTTKIRNYSEQKMQLPLDKYFKMAFFVYAVFAGKDRFFVKEDYFIPQNLDDANRSALDYVLSQISQTLPEMKKLCKDFCNYDEERIFGYYNDAPHVKFPLIRDKGGYFCTIPNYIPSALLDGLYYRLDIPNSCEPDINKEFSENMENYLGMIFEHFLKRSKVNYLQEITYDIGKRKSQRTSDWILWDHADICFLDCKTKRISVKGKQAVTVDDEEINRVVIDKPFSSTRKKKEIDDRIPEGITKDLILIGIGVGKIFVSYDDYQKGNIEAFPFMDGKKFHAVLLTLEGSFSNSPGYKERILKVAQSYRKAKSGESEQIEKESVKILSLKHIEEYACVIAKEGLGYFLEHHMNSKLMAQKRENDRFLVDKCKTELINPFIEELKPYWKR